MCVALAGLAVNFPQLPIYVLFGRPGAGKSTLASAATKNANNCLLLDLDVCVSNAMRENFSKGIYPTSRQRVEFMNSACDYVANILLEM